MTTDPTSLPDDHVAAGRARALALQHAAEEALGKVIAEAFQYRCLYEKGTELIGVMDTSLAEARQEIDALQAVVEKIIALARAEEWRYVDHTVGGTIFFNEQEGWRLTIARALLAAGMDWRADAK